MNYLFNMNRLDLLKLANIKRVEVEKRNNFRNTSVGNNENSSKNFIIKTEEKAKFNADINLVREDIAFIDKLMGDYLEAVNDVTKLPEEKVSRFFDRSKTAISKLDSLKSIILHLNEIFEQEKLYNIKGKDLVSFIGNKSDNPVLEIPNGIEKICSKAFNCVEGVVKVILPDSVKVIEEDAFYKCRTLIQVIVPEQLKNLNGTKVEFCHMAKYYLKNEK